MHVIDDATMQEIFRFVKAHKRFARTNRILRERALEMAVILRQLEELVKDVENYKDPGAKKKAS